MEHKIKTKTCAYDSHLARFFHTLQHDVLPGVDFVIAGGSCRKLLVGEKLEGSDIDLWFSDVNEIDKATDVLRRYLIAETPNSFNYRLQSGETQIGAYRLKIEEEVVIQLIRRDMHPTILDLLDHFDFTVCQVAYKDGTLFFTDEAEKDLSTKTLNWNPGHSQPLDPFRVMKYMFYGYQPSLEFYQKFFLGERSRIPARSTDFAITGKNAFYG